MMRLFKHLRRFRDDENGSLAVETVLILPVLFWAYLSMFAVFDAYRQHSLNQKAAFTISDIISRQTTPINQAYMNGLREMLAYLTANRTQDVALRVTSVRYVENGNNKQYKRDWSKRKGWMPPLSNSAVKALKNDLPIMPNNERVTVVETFVKYDPPFNTGLKEREIHNFVFTRPRYAPRVLWANN